tara:strand:- start:3942 stop:4727 length:786 start_codon:yes stop_codon:yes gene_type:complete
MQMPQNSFKQALQSGSQQYGLWLGLCNALSAELCGHCGYDWLLIDAEHAPNDLNSIHTQLLAIENTPSHAVIRLVDDNPALIKQVLDLGAQSLLIPMVETADQASALVSAVHYPPAGTRGVGTALARAARWNQVDNYMQQADAEVCLLIQIESVTALENLDDILAVEGIDGVFIGPADLAGSMGHLGNSAHPEVVSAVESAIARIRASGKAAGTLVADPTLARQYENKGVQFLALAVDTLLLAKGAKLTLERYLSDNEDKN